jgi:hypothetical protein
MDGDRRFGAIRYNLHGRLQSAWVQPHPARVPIAIHLAMGSGISETGGENAFSIVDGRDKPGHDG